MLSTANTNANLPIPPAGLLPLCLYRISVHFSKINVPFGSLTKHIHIASYIELNGCTSFLVDIFFPLAKKYSKFLLVQALI